MAILIPMSRRHQHEEHTNTEAWAIPYGDLVTLLLAFFVVMYAISSVNEGKYRVMSDSLAAAFRGSPRTMQPVQVGEKSVGSGADIEMSIVNQAMLEGQPRSMLAPTPITTSERPQHMSNAASHAEYAVQTTQSAAVVRQLETVADQVEQAMAGLVQQNLIAVRRHGLWVEVEIRTDILFPSGVATLSPDARKVIAQLGETIKPFPNPIRVEGHTDNLPIKNSAFPSNWELSSARAASVVHLFTEVGVNPARLAVIGLGEFRPSKANDTVEGRNTNRRVVLVILGGDGSPEGSYAGERGEHGESPNDLPGEDAPTEAHPVEAQPATPIQTLRTDQSAVSPGIEAASPAIAIPAAPAT